MEKISIKNRILTYRGVDYDISSYERIGNEFLHITTNIGMTISFVPKETEINGSIVNSLDEIESYIDDIIS